MVFNAWTLEVMKARMSSIDFRSCESLNLVLYVFSECVQRRCMLIAETFKSRYYNECQLICGE